METYKIKLDAFEGPMDLLLHLIDKHQINIYDIPIAELTQQYLDYLETGNFNIENTSEFLIMAATLLQIKAKMMLPKQKTEEEIEEDPRLELVERIIEYRRYKEVTQELLSMIQREDKSCSRAPTMLPVEYLPPRNIPLEVLIAAFNAAMETEEKASIPEVLVAREEYRIEDKMEEVLKILNYEGGKILFSDAFKTLARTELIITFLAVLELVRNDKISVMQKGNFSEIYIVMKEGAVDERNFGDT